MQAFAKNKTARSTPAQSRDNGPFFGIQAKLKVGKKGDAYETEADHVAEQVVNKTSGNESQPFFSPATPSVQLKSEKPIAQSITPYVQLKEAEEETVQHKEDEEIQKTEEEEIQKQEEEESIQPKDDEDVQMEEEEEVQSKEEEEEVQMLRIGNTPGPVNMNISSQLRSARGTGQQLPQGTRQQMESGFGTDLSGVRIHDGSTAAQMNQQLGAKAFTNGSDIYFNQGNFKPGTREGDTLLAHELTHTIQQGAVAPNAQPQQAGENLAKTANATTQSPSSNNELPSGESQTATSTMADTTPVEGQDIHVAPPAVEGQPQATGGEPATEEAVHTTPRSPEEDPNFRAAEQQVENRAGGQQATEPATQASAAAQSASPVPTNEREGSAQASQVEVMDEQEPGTFDAAAFKAQLMARIEAMQLPANEEEADDFENNNNIDEVTDAGTQMASAERQNAAGPIEQATTAPPNTDAVPEREVTPLPEPNVGTPPAPVAAAQAMPPRRGDAEVSQPLQENMQSVDQQMQDNEVTDEMLANSNEPSFTGALDSKTQAREHTEQAPQGFRQQESQTLGASQQSAQSQSAQGLQEMHTSRDGALHTVMQQQQGTSTQDSAERERIAGEINTIYESTKTDVETILTALDEQVTEKFTAAAERAKTIFEDYVERKMDAYKDERYSGVGGALTWVGDAFTGLPDEVNAFFVEGREKYIEAMDGELTSISQYIAEKLTEAQQRIEQGKTEVSDYVDSLPENLQSIGQEAADEIQDKFDELTDNVNSKQDELIDALANQYQESLAAVDARIEEMQAENRGLIDMALDAVVGVINTIIEIKNMLTNLLSAAISAIGAIISDPIGFLGNLLRGVKDGFLNFGKNILRHLMSGLVTWLTGALGPMGITIPDDIFSLKGIFSLVMQVLGLTWDYMRQKAVKLLGEPVVQALEVGFEIFQIIRTQGIAGVWEYLKEQFNDLKETVIDAIQEMIISQVVEAGIKWVLGLMSPAGAFVKAAMMIIDIVKFFIERGSQIIALVNAFIEGVQAVAAGNVTAIATKIEEALGRAVPVIIGFLANLLGIGGLARKVQKLIGKIRKRIDKAIDKLILKAKQMGRRVLQRLGVGRNPDGSAAEGEEGDGEIGKTVNFTDGEERHRLWVDESSGNPIVKVASNPIAVEEKITEWKGKINTQGFPDEKKVEVNGLIASAEGKLNTLKSDVQTADREDDNGEVSVSLDNKIEGEEETLADTLKKLFQAFGESNSLTVPVTPNTKIKAKYKTSHYKAVVKEVDENASSPADNKVKHQFNWEKLKERDKVNPFDQFNQQWESGDITEDNSGESDHSEYKPQNVELTIDSGHFFLKYNYGPEGLDTDELIHFDVGMGIDQAANDEITHVVMGSNLMVKEPGTRGRVDSSGKIITEGYDTSNLPALHSAHLLADWFRGSGYRGGLNLILTSDTYNTQTMLNAEEQVHSSIMSISNSNPGRLVTFDLLVTARYKVANDDGILQALRILKSDVNDADLNEIYSILSGKQDPRMCQGVEYDIMNVYIDGQSAPHNIRIQPIGPDDTLIKSMN
ncbi:MAG: hypothetical protein CL868_14905 [Cytophagaceae bacterium]|nr:hypothetical protein [Cytophagaceae bacterium]